MSDDPTDSLPSRAPYRGTPFPARNWRDTRPLPFYLQVPRKPVQYRFESQYPMSGRTRPRELVALGGEPDELHLLAEEPKYGEQVFGLFHRRTQVLIRMYE